MKRLLALASLAAGLSLLVSPLAAQSVRLPLPVDGPAGALAFEAPAPTAGVLTGVLIPSVGALTSWAPVWSTLEADGTLKEAQTGGWIGPRPDRWLKIAQPGSAVAGFRFLLKTAPGVETRQMQIFWRPWIEGEIRGEGTTSLVYGQAAEESDTVKIIELRLPEKAAPIGLYGQTLGGRVVQVSLLVRQPPAPPPVAGADPASSFPSSSSLPSGSVPSGPSMPKAPSVSSPLLK